MKSKFRAGNRVINNDFGAGTVIGVGIWGSPLVEFDNARDGFHDGNGSEICGTKGKKGHCWYIKNIKPLSNQAIVIYPKGLETIALLKEGKKIIKQATAKCNPSDTYDFNIGAKLAFQRLMGEEVTTGVMPYREVKRPAKVGEWIKVVKSNFVPNSYKVGDIYRALEVNKYNQVRINDKCTYYDWVSELSGYVVLENYQPEETIRPSLSMYTDKELIDELSKRWEDR